MKVVSFIIALYILAIGILPCTDAAPTDNQHQQTAFITNSTAQDNHFHLDFCSPFCTCSCCHIGIDRPQEPDETIFDFAITSPDELPVISSKQKVLSSFWQPPRIS